MADAVFGGVQPIPSGPCRAVIPNLMFWRPQSCTSRHDRDPTSLVVYVLFISYHMLLVVGCKSFKHLSYEHWIVYHPLTGAILRRQRKYAVFLVGTQVFMSNYEF